MVPACTSRSQTIRNNNVFTEPCLNTCNNLNYFPILLNAKLSSQHFPLKCRKTLFQRSSVVRLILRIQVAEPAFTTATQLRKAVFWLLASEICRLNRQKHECDRISHSDMALENEAASVQAMPPWERLKTGKVFGMHPFHCMDHGPIPMRFREQMLWEPMIWKSTLKVCDVKNYSIEFKELPTDNGQNLHPRPSMMESLVLFLIAASAAALGSHHLAAHTPRAASTKWRGQGKVNVLLTVKANQEGRNVTDLLAHTDVALADQSASMMDGLGQAQPEDLGLQPALHDLGRGQAQHEIELLLRFKEQSKADHAAKQGLSLEDTHWALFQGQQRSGCSSDLGQGILHTPHLTLVLQSVLTNDLHLSIKTLLLERPLGLTEGLAIVLIALLSHG